MHGSSGAFNVGIYVYADRMELQRPAPRENALRTSWVKQWMVSKRLDVGRRD